MSHQQSPGGRNLGLDLIRAIAIVLVLLSHWSGHFGYWFATPLCPATMDRLGDLGVELFFALSGFLIGRILLDLTERPPTWHGLRIFMLRRWLRTLPPYFIWLAMLLVVVPPQQDIAGSALRFATLTQNLLWPMPPDYYFAVTWSLAIEEWFYLLFGAVLIGLSRRIGRRRALPWCLLAFMVPPLLLRLATLQGPGIVAWRLDEIAYGVLMAHLQAKGHWLFRHPRIALASGLGLIGAAVCAALPVPSPLDIPLTPNAEILGAALCLPAALRLGRIMRRAETVIRWLATRSYALYLVHLTILYDVVERGLFETGWLSAWACVPIAIAVPFLMAELSYHGLEQPLLRRRPPQHVLNLDHQARRPRRGIEALLRIPAHQP